MNGGQERSDTGNGLDERRKALRNTLKRVALRLLSCRPQGFRVDDLDLGIAVATSASMQPGSANRISARTRDESLLIIAAQELLSLERTRASALPLIDGSRLYLGEAAAIERLISIRARRS